VASTNFVTVVNALTSHGEEASEPTKLRSAGFLGHLAIANVVVLYANQVVGAGAGAGAAGVLAATAAAKGA
jgi:hypothetical protein